MHLKLSAAERTAYKICCQQARSRPSTYMSLIIDYSNPISLPSHMPVPKSWMHYGNRFTYSFGGLIDHYQGKHLFLHPQSFWPKDSNLTITNLFSHICYRILNTDPSHRPSILYLQADNCWSEKKNVWLETLTKTLVSWLSSHINGLEGHSVPHVFHF